MGSFYYDKGMRSFQLKNYEKAVQDFTDALAEHESSGAYQNRAAAYMYLGNFKLAGADYEKSIELITELLKKTDKSKTKYFEMGLRDILSCKSAIAYIKLEKRNFDQAEQLNSELLEIHSAIINKDLIPQNLHVSHVYCNRASARFNLKKLDHAAEDLAIAYIKSNSGDIRANAMVLSNKFGLADKVNEYIESLTHQNYDLNFIFKSDDHLRYENGQHVSGPHGGEFREVKVEPNIHGGEGYTVTIFNTERNEASMQIAPKQMKILYADKEKIILRGFGNDIFGTSFEDYGLTIYYSDGDIIKIALHMHDRNIDIVYFTI